MLQRTIEKTPVSSDSLRIPDAQPGSSTGPGSVHNVRGGEELVGRVGIGASIAFWGEKEDSLRRCEMSSTVGLQPLSVY